MADRDTNLGRLAWFKTHSLTGQTYTVQSSYVCNLPEVLDSTEFAPEEVAAAKRNATRQAKRNRGFTNALF